MDPNKLKYAAIGGVLAGLASSIPIVSMLNFCCCAWALGGGFLATFLYNKGMGSRGVTPAEGATLGALAGAIGGPIYLVLNTILTIIMGPLTAEMMKGFGVDVPGGGAGVGSAIFASLMGMVVLAIFTTLGGLIASLIFKPTGGAPPSYPGVGSGPGAPFGQPGGTPYGQQGSNPYGQGGGDPYGGGGGQGGTGY